MNKSILKKTKFWLALVLLLIISSFLVFRGIRTGLPSNERLQHELGGADTVTAKEKELSAFLSSKKHVRSEFLSKNEKPEMAEMSPYFDQVRSYHPDEQYILKILAEMAVKKDFQPSSFIYGPFFFYQCGSGIFAAKLAGQLPNQQDPIYFMKNPDNFAPVYLSARIIIAAMAVLAVLVVFFIGIELKDLYSGLIAALLLCSIPLFNLAGKFIKPDTPCLLWSSFSLLFSIYAYKYGRIRDYLLAGVFVALAAGSKYPGILSCFYVAAYFWARNYDNSRKLSENTKMILKGKEFKYLIFSGLACITAFIITNPSCILRPKTFQHDFSWIAGVLRNNNFFTNLFDFIISFLYDGFFYTTGPTIILLFIAGIFYIIFKRNKIYLAMLPVVLLFIIMASRGRLGSDAYLLPAYVPMCLIGTHLIRKIKKKYLSWAILILVVTPSIGITLAYNSIASGENARLKATKWINKNLPARSTISRLQYSVSYRTAMTPPQSYTQYSMDFQPQKSTQADYFIDSSFEWQGAFWDKRFDKSFEPSKPPSDDFVKIKVIENVPLVFGFIPLSRHYMLTSYIETVSPRITIYKRDNQKNVSKPKSISNISNI